MLPASRVLVIPELGIDGRIILKWILKGRALDFSGSWQRPVESCFEHGNGPYVYIQLKKCFYCLRTCYFLKLHFAPCSCLVRCSCLDVVCVGTETQLDVCVTGHHQYNGVSNQQYGKTFSFITPLKSALHVSGDKFAHNQEHFFDCIYSFWCSALVGTVLGKLCVNTTM